ncbi:kinase-like domain-containing protein [Pholiota molesta]|nr:kinase-like domain-containing protein [Pholiota molesta]
MPLNNFDNCGIDVNPTLQTGSDLVDKAHLVHPIHSLPHGAVNPDATSILDVLEKLERSRKMCFNRYRNWYNLHDGRCLKITDPRSDRGIEEARVMDFIRTHTSIPVPQILMLFSDAEGRYMVMEYIPAPSLESVYNSCSLEELQGIIQQIGDIIQQIRSLPIPQQDTIGAWQGKPFNNVIFDPLPWDKYPPLASAFKSVAEFDAFWLKRSKIDISLPSPAAARIVLSHGDLHGGNILVKDGKVVGVVDWDTFGWDSLRTTGLLWSKALESELGPEGEFQRCYQKLILESYREPVRY